MIEEKQKNLVDVSDMLARKSPGRFRLRRMTALELAEGALLADIGVVLQIFIKYLPVGGDVLRLLVPVVFAVIVLRRGLYVGCMSMCVSLFIISIVSGAHGAP